MTKNYLRRLIPILAIAATSSSEMIAQSSTKPMCIEVNAGYREYLGDLGSSLFFKKKPDYQGLGINFGYQVKPTIDAVFNFTTGDVGYYTIVPWQIPIYKTPGFRANTIDATLGLRFKLGNLIKKGDDAKLNPYLYAGFGGYYIHSAIRNRVQHITDMGANIQFGGGISYQFTEVWGIRWSWTGNYTMNDRWDGANGNPDNLIHELYRTNDLYSHHAIGITYSFGEGNGDPKVKKFKDEDKDDVWDKLDKCKGTPEKYRDLVDSFGCPLDSDKDSILDADDACPKVWGPRKFNGCPDTDGDGIEDKVDACPTIAGLAAFNGCPDSDGDGVQDKDDQCPKVKGEIAFNGCPDGDGDGVEDRKDKCPTVAGAIAGEGCPDTDGDGVYDNIDKCKDKVGTVENKGCPEIQQAVVERIRQSAAGIFFDVNKDVIQARSYANLDKLVTIMNEFPEATVSIEGHTDSDGDNAKNLTLSQQRADAVKKYLIEHGVAADRLTATGFGETMPILVNGKEDKNKSRRVDFKLKY